MAEIRRQLSIAQSVDRGRSSAISWRNPLGLPLPLTRQQIFYIACIQGIGAACIDGGANFAIAYGMYHQQDNITMWQLAHNTIAGDCAVTTFIQGILTFVIASSMVHVDLRNKKIDPFPYAWPDQAFAVVKLSRGPDEAKSRRGYLWRTFHQEHGLGRGLHFFSGSDANDLFNFNVPRKTWFFRLFLSVWKGSVLSALYFLVLWPITIAIIAPIWGGRNMANTWVPQSIKLVYGFVLGITMNPIVACIALGSEDAVELHHRDVHEKRIHDEAERGAAYNTNAEMAIARPSLVLTRSRT